MAKVFIVENNLLPDDKSKCHESHSCEILQLDISYDILKTTDNQMLTTHIIGL